MRPGTQINRYIVDKVISDRGGMAVVYLAHLSQDEKFKLAIKVARTNSTGKAHEDLFLEREAELLQRWDWRHPGIVRVFPSPFGSGKPQYSMRAAELPDAPYFMVMEYLRGETLSENLKIIQTYPLAWKLELFYQILLTVSFIHSKGYAHRDLKPDNIVFRDPIAPTILPQPVLVDFALTTNADQSYEIVDNSLTYHYSPPERIAKSMGMTVQTDFQAADVWGLGMILYEILTGKYMIKGKLEHVKTTIIRERLEPALPNDNPDHHILAAFIREMLNPDLEKRPTIDLVLKAIESKFIPPRIPLQ